MSPNSSSAASPTPSTPFEMSEIGPPSSVASSPPPFEEVVSEEEEEADKEDANEDRFKRLEFVLQKSALFAEVLRSNMETAKARQREQLLEEEEAKAKGKKRARAEEADAPLKRRKGAEGSVDSNVQVDKNEDSKNISDSPILKQPSLITGAKMKDFQLEGLQWMISLHANGISGILADEMGLGKTLQTISFTAYLREVKFSGHILIVCPLSVMHNWVTEYEKFAPSIPVCMYHGSPAERAELRNTVLAPPPVAKQKTAPKPKPKPKGKGRGKGRGRAKKPEPEPELEPELEGDEEEDEVDPRTLAFPVVITTYEMIIRDRAHLANYNWGYIVVDEGHRLKNMDCKLMQEIKKYNASSRMILTGTPLHNNLGELWALLNFVLPSIFNDLDSFQEWFNLPTMQTTLGDRAAKIIDSLHAILKPFLLRRLKVDVETTLPPKKEYVLYAPLSAVQREAYTRVIDGTLRQYLLGKESTKAQANVDDGPRKLRGRKVKKYQELDGDDDEYFDMVENGQVDERGVVPEKEPENLEKISQEHREKATKKQVNNMRLQNTVMQLRKVCSHPFLFEWPEDPITHQRVLNDDLVDTSGKMMVLDRLLTELFQRKHKVLLFSQFTTMLDIIEDWAIEMKGWKICRIDGSTSPLERRSQMNEFQNGGTKRDAPQLFLLSTRAGGLGVNLVAADTVIFYDQDWNPQMDAQAQDRAHRIGQTKPVLIFRLVSAHTIETKIMQKATEKRKLEALVIAKGKFRMPAGAAKASNSKQSAAELAAALLQLEGEKIEVVPNTVEGKRNVISDMELEMLLDRSPEVFSGRGEGWASKERNAAFEVFQAPKDEGNDALAKMLGEDVE